MAQQSSQIQDTYNNQYLNEDNKWRNLGGNQKSSNIIELCSKINHETVIDVGSGDGSVIDWLIKKKFSNNITCLEISDSGIEAIKNRKLSQIKEIKKFDGYNIQVENKKFNLALCSHVIEHVEHPRLLLREIARISDYQYFEVPIDFSFFVDKKLSHYLSYGHINIFTPSLFKFLLKSEGFEIIDENFLFTDKQQIKYQFKNNKKRYFIQLIKNFIVSNTFLKRIKPNAYSVLCKHNGTSLNIFN